MKNMKSTIVKTVIITLFLATGFAYGQGKDGFIPPSIDDDDIPIAKTELPVPEEGEDFVARYFKGTTDGIESRIAIKKLGYILRPAMVKVISEDGRELAVELVKKNWDDVVRSGTTKDGEYSTSFKTAMEFGIKVSASENGIPFIVAISAGKELFPASNLFVDAGTMRANNEPEEGASYITVDESKDSNSTILMAIIFALIAVISLLVFFFLKRKYKGTATLLLLLFALWPLNANVPVGVSGSAVGKMATAIANAFAKHYGSGGFRNDDPLSEDDKDHEPETDPRGQPTLPSSCYTIARISQSGIGSGGGTSKGGGQSKNPTGNMGTGGIAGGNTGNTLSTGPRPDVGGVAGSSAGSDASPNFETQNNESGAGLDQALEEARIEYENLNLDTEKSYQEGLARAQSAYDHITGVTRNDYNTARETATGNPEEQARLAAEFSSRITELTEIYNQRIAETNQRKTDMMVQNAAHYSNRVAEIMAAYDNSKDPGQDPEKDKDREDKKNPDGEGENKGGGKGAGEPEGSGNPGGSGGDNPGEDDSAEGCDCLELAYKELQENRHTLEKLLKIGQHTKKVTDFGISFGDNFSGIHGVSGLAWQTERAKVIKSIEKFDNTYNNKYKELIEKLYNTLLWIDDCEKQLGYENWYSHSGFIYYEFMKVRYASYK